MSAYSSGGGSTTIDMNDMLLAPPPANTGRGRASSMIVAISSAPAVREQRAHLLSPTTAGNSAYPQTLAGASKASAARSSLQVSHSASVAAWIAVAAGITESFDVGTR